MKRLRAAPLLALALAACSDTPTAPRLSASVEILLDALPFDEQTLRVGETVSLRASPRDDAGKELPGRPVRWSSTRPEVATVDTAGLVRGVGLGTTLIVAASDDRADTARINVAAPVSGPVACAPGQSPLALDVGQVYSTNAWDLGTICLHGGAAGAEYLVMPFHASAAAGGQVLALEMRAAGVVPVATAATARAPAEAEGGEAGDRRDEDFHLRLRERALPGLSRRRLEMPERGGLLPSRALLAAAVPRVGEHLRLNVETRSADGCADPRYRSGRVVAVTQRAVIVADTANPAGGFTDAEYRAFGEAFDRLVYPVAVRYFGEPSDLDRNQRAIIFFTSAVNDLTRAGSGFYIGGFFYDRDLFPRSGQGSCAGSNVGEMFYMMVPDPQRAPQEPAFGKARVTESTVSVIAHEFQHLINASRRLHVNKAPRWEEMWLNEGLSHIAEELLFFHASGLTPRGNEDGSRLLADPARRALLDYQVNNLERYVQFLRVPHTASLMGGDVLPTRGAIWNFLRYAADRQGADEVALWNRLANSKTAGVANLAEVFGPDVASWMHDWALSQYLDDAGMAVAERYEQPSWNFRQLFPRLQGVLQSTGFRGYPLRTLRFESDGYLGLSLPTSSAAYVRFGVPSQQRAAVRVTSGDLPAPRKLRVTVVRTR